MRRSRILFSGLAVWGMGAVAAAAQETPLEEGGAVSRPELVRCRTSSEAPCFRTLVTLPPEAATREAADSSLAEDAWFAHLDGDVFGCSTGPSEGTERCWVRQPPVTDQPLTLLVLVDVSGSMAVGGRSAFTVFPLRKFLSELPTGWARVAVAPFASSSVVELIGQSAFVPPIDALGQLDRLPAPQGNTGLYSAVEAGVRAVEEARDGQGWGAVLVITDGRNDVGNPGDDPGLLEGDAGRQSVLDAIRRGEAHVWTVGLAERDVDRSELEALASVRGRAYVLRGADPSALDEVLTEIRGLILREREITVAPDARREVMGRRALVDSIVYRPASEVGAGFASGATWSPPFLALPAFSGVADHAGVVVSDAGSPVARRLIILGGFGLVFWFLWSAVPALGWLGPARPTVAKKSEPSLRQRLKAKRKERQARQGQPAGPALRTDVREAPPRKPTDVTSSEARRVVRKIRRPKPE